MDENRYTNDYYTNQNQMNQGQVNQNQNSSSGTQGTNYYQPSPFPLKPKEGNFSLPPNSMNKTYQ